MANYLIVGGTGTLGSALTASLLKEEQNVTVFSRCELKQAEMRSRFPAARYVLGDVRDIDSLESAMTGVDTVFHVAALKHVDAGEANPQEFIKTNVQGTINVATAAMRCGVADVVFSSTDKAVLPINVYGMTKGIAERYLLGLNDVQYQTYFSVYRWGNVLGSRGSVVHSFASSLKSVGMVRLTDMRMSRFWIHIDDAVAYMMTTFSSRGGVDIRVPPMKAAKVVDLAQAMARIMGVKNVVISVTGSRPGEKIHETLVSSHAFCLRSDTAEQYTPDELEALLTRVIAC